MVHGHGLGGRFNRQDTDRALRTAEAARAAAQDAQANGSSVVVRVNGVEVGKFSAMNLLDAGNFTVTAAADPLNNEIELSFQLDASPDFASLRVGGVQVVGAQGAAVPDAAGGVTVDTEARAAINDLLAILRTHGLIET